jgi:hypothetical protein
MAERLVYKDAEGRRIVVDLASQQVVVIGSGPEADIRVENPSISGRHCRVLQDGGRWVVEDLDSADGTYVNGVEVKRRVLAPEDFIRCGPLQVLIVRFATGDEDEIGAGDSTMLREDLDAAQDEVALLRETARRASHDAHDTGRRLAEAEEQATHAREMLRNLSTIHAEVAAEAGRLQRRVLDLRAELESAGQRTAERDRAAREAEAQVARLRLDLERALASLSVKEAERQVIAQANAAAAERIIDLERVVDATQKIVADLRRELAFLKRDLDEARRRPNARIADE